MSILCRSSSAYKMHKIMLKLMCIHSSPPICFDQTCGYLQGGKVQRMNTLKIITKLAEFQNQNTDIQCYICVLVPTCDTYIYIYIYIYIYTSHIRHVISI
jgi:hypothetical protein